LTESWNGTAWVIEPTPDPAGATATFLNSVTCRSATTCEAVGRYQDGSGAWFTLAQRWSGKAWLTQPTPSPAGGTYNQLTGVACPSARKCTAVGVDTASDGLTNTLAEQWNGTTWTIEPIPSPAGIRAQLDSVACPTTRSCTAAGFTSPRAHHPPRRTMERQNLDPRRPLPPGRKRSQRTRRPSRPQVGNLCAGL